MMSPKLSNVCMDGVNAMVLGKVLKLPSVNGARFEINQLLFVDDIALVANSARKFC